MGPKIPIKIQQIKIQIGLVVLRYNQWRLEALKQAKARCKKHLEGRLKG
ncbi:hypothetical protein [Psychroflexus torquis]|nr:hypothetical protein [Psychroflexus torquis]